MNQQLTHLSGKIEERLKSSNYSMDLFPQIAVECVRSEEFQQFLSGFSISGLGQWIAQTPDFPKQLDPGNHFAQPPITLFSDPQGNFVIDVYHWINPEDTGIHDHGFAGACLVWKGNCLHVEYQFDDRRETGAGLLHGRLAPFRQSYLQPGDSFSITAGPSFIHKNVHLSLPTITFVIRTSCRRPGLRQFNYYPGGLAVELGRFNTIRIAKQFAFWRLLHITRDPGEIPYLREVLHNLDREAALYFFISLVERTRNVALLDVLLPVVRQRFGEVWFEGLEDHLASGARPGRNLTDSERKFLCSVGVES